jgi:hypothetical protein
MTTYLNKSVEKQGVLGQDSHPTIVYLRPRRDSLWVTWSVQIKVKNARSLLLSEAFPDCTLPSLLPISQLP